MVTRWLWPFQMGDSLGFLGLFGSREAFPEALHRPSLACHWPTLNQSFHKSVTDKGNRLALGGLGSSFGCNV